MNTDFRIAVSFRGHRKRKRLRRLLGEGYLDYVIDLWAGVTMTKPDGILSGWSVDDICDEAGWCGEPMVFIEAMLDTFMDVDEKGVYSMHDWEEHQPWVVGSEARSKKAKLAAKARWERRLNATSIDNNATSNATSIDNNATSNAPSPTLSSPNLSKEKLLSEFKKKNPDAHIWTADFKKWGSSDDLKLAEFIHKKLSEKFPKTPSAKFGNWANDIRLMRVHDKHSHTEIQNVFLWAHNDDSFWAGNILSTGKLRKQFSTIHAKMITSGGVIIAEHEDLDANAAWDEHVKKLDAAKKERNDIHA